MAVAAFLAGQLSFVQIPVIIAKTLERAVFPAPLTMSDVLQIDADSRALSAELIVKAVEKSAGTQP